MNRLGKAEEKISELKDRTFKIAEALWEFQKENREKGTDLFKEITAKKFPRYERNRHIKETKKMPAKINLKRPHQDTS